jgi:hypothetical protein
VRRRPSLAGRLAVSTVSVVSVLALSLPALSVPATAAGPVAGAVAPAGDERPEVSGLRAPAAVERFARFESTATIAPEPVNPFDSTQIDVQGVFRDPSGREHRLAGFYYQGYRRRLLDGRERLTERGEPVWKVRFAPPTAGRWKWWWEVRTSVGTVETKPRSLRVRRGDDPGYVRASERDPRYLVFDDGSPYFALGENVGWYDDRGTFAYDEWYARLAEQDASYSRLWMASFSFGLEWDDTPLGDYRRRLDRAWQLDHVIEEGERRGIYAVLSLLNHGAFSTVFNADWGENPYNAANGGPLSSPAEFFTNEAARELFTQRLRYIVARWGYSTHVLAWELWNEVDLTDGYDSVAVTAWHQEMADELRRLDPADHLVSTSFAFAGSDPAVWAGAGLDYTQLHAYARAAVGDTVIELFSNVPRHVAELTAARLDETPLPVLFAELGVDARGPGETMDADPRGIGIHDGLWAGALSGGFGTAMTWWWDNLIDVQPRRYYPMFGSVARFLEGIDWDREGFGPANASVTSPSRPLVLYGLRGDDHVLVWVKDDAYQWNAPQRVKVADASVTLAPLASGSWCGAWWDTWTGDRTGEVELDGGTGAVTLMPPPFTGDIALRLEPCQSAGK